MPLTLTFFYYGFCLTLQIDAILIFHLQQFRPFEEFFSLVSVGICTILTLKLLQQYNIWRLDYFSDDTTDGVAAYNPLYIYMSVLIYGIGYSGYVRKELGSGRILLEPEKPARELTAEEKKRLDAFIKTVQDKRLYAQSALKLKPGWGESHE